MQFLLFPSGSSKIHRGISGPVPARAGPDFVPSVRPHVPRARLQRPRGGGQEIRRRIRSHARDILSSEIKDLIMIFDYIRPPQHCYIFILVS